jgi:diguanylate cyclase (GGDEF)-like protein
MKHPNRELRLYDWLTRTPLRDSYRAKLLSVAVVGTHVPFLALVIYVVAATDQSPILRVEIVALALAATLAGGGLTLLAMSAILRPVTVVSNALHAYVHERRRPALPTGYPDVVGRLMSDVQTTVGRLDALMSELEQQVGIDGLTETMTRRWGEQRLAEDLHRSHRAHRSLCIAVIDLDNLKPINDRYGHLAGDLVLRHLASVVRSNIRETDWIARWGGDEFVVGLGQASDDEAKAIAARILEGIRDKPVQLTDGTALPITVSIGLSELNGDETASELFGKADSALLEAKQTGRDRVVVYGA